MKKIFLPIFFVFILTSQVWAEMAVEVIPLHSRQVEEMIPIIQSLLHGEGTVSGINGQLIVRATPRDLAEIKKVLTQLDSPPRNLLITVKQGLRESLEKEEAAVAADVRIGKGRVIISPDGGSLRNGGVSDDGGVTARLGKESVASDAMDVQRVRALEGRAAMIYVGQSVPFKQEHVVRNGSNIIREDSVTFKEVTTGFSVLPRLQGNQVTIEVNPTRSTFVDGQIEAQSLSTTLTGKLGEWMELGGIVQKGRAQRSGIGSHATSSSDERRSVFIKVDEL